MKKLALTVLYIGIAYGVYLYGDSLLAWFQQANNPVITTLMATFMALFPVIPYPIVGGVIGAAYGPLSGGIITWIGSSMASLIMFIFVRYGYQEWGAQFLKKYKRTEQVTLLFERNAFLVILFSRMIPIIPSIFINIYSALSRVSFMVYALASSIGKVPAMLLFAFVGDNLVSDPKNLIVTIGVYAIFFSITIFLYRLWERRYRT
ncbi:TVP38/TMEM64 family protein [Ammoniphilus sp. CFH 90114]|uniref:TVP38/TMEM64 family protein n=1 Tax=Ammoniphilus sp. CFH 90114 TaxID=2493665 RepID=UPI00100E804B|nr:TVP38/TMEM64 family protein [Ammoniphilus sp. CFH 90114]